MIQTILLATDGSAAANRAAKFARSLAAQYDAKVIVVHAYHPIPSYLGEPFLSQAQRNALEAAQSLIVDAARRLNEMGVTDVDTNFVAGPPADVILTLAETRKPDLIVVGARGLPVIAHPA